MSPTAPPSRRLNLADAAATRRLGAELAERLAPTAGLLLLEGDLGAGKTCLVQGLAAALGIEEPVTSPTFALSHHYAPAAASSGGPGATRGQGGLVHLDLYRLEQPAAADELFAQEEEAARELGAVLAVEWPQRLSIQPAESWRVTLQLLDGADPEAGRRALIWEPLSRLPR